MLLKTDAWVSIEGVPLPVCVPTRPGRLKLSPSPYQYIHNIQMSFRRFGVGGQCEITDQVF